MINRVGVYNIVNFMLLGCCLLPLGCGTEVLEGAKKSQEEVAPHHVFFKKSFELMAKIESQTDLLFPLAVKMPPVKKGEWRYFWNQPEQSPQKFITSMPNRITEDHSKLYVKPIGRFEGEDQVLLAKIAQFLHYNFQTPVVIMDPVSSSLPEDAYRYNKNKEKQLSSIYITDDLLKKELPEDGWGIIGITLADIYQAEGVDRLYGDSLLFGRRGVISLKHLRSSDKVKELSLAIKGTSHEVTHMLSLPHCKEYRCNMNGRITIEEFEDAPLHYSPDCLSKLIFATGADIKERFVGLIKYCQENQLNEELDYYTRALNILDSQQ